MVKHNINNNNAEKRNGTGKVKKRGGEIDYGDKVLLANVTGNVNMHPEREVVANKKDH